MNEIWGVTMGIMRMDKESKKEIMTHLNTYWVRKILWRRQWLPTPVFLPEDSHGQRSLMGYSPWGGKKSNMTEAT